MAHRRRPPSLDRGNAYDALACLFGIRNSFGFPPLAEGRGLPTDASGWISRRSVAGPGSRWAAVWDVMGTLAGPHGSSYVRIVVRFD